MSVIQYEYTCRNEAGQCPGFSQCWRVVSLNRWQLMCRVGQTVFSVAYHINATIQGKFKWISPKCSESSREWRITCYFMQLLNFPCKLVQTHYDQNISSSSAVDIFVITVSDIMQFVVLSPWWWLMRYYLHTSGKNFLNMLLPLSLINVIIQDQYWLWPT